MTTRSIALTLALVLLPLTSLTACGETGETAATQPSEREAVEQPAAPLPVPMVDVPLVATTDDGQHHVVDLAPGALRVLPRPVVMVGSGPLVYYWTDCDQTRRPWVDDVDLGAWAKVLYLQTEGETEIGGTIRYEYPQL